MPEGGPPDLKSPEVLRTVPAAGDVSVPRTASFTIEFSEPVEPSTMIPGLFVSPPLTGTPSMKWSGRVVRMAWPDSLRADVTYRLTFGAKLTDRHQNRIKEPVTIAFSTGSHIDSCRIRGTVWTLEPQTTALEVLAYRVDSTRVWPYPQPDFVTQTGTDGQFDLPYIPPAIYRLVAVGDRNRNGKPDQNELIAIADAPVNLNLHTAISGLRLFAQPYDTTAFAISACTQSSDGAILVGLSHSADTSGWSSSWLTVTDSAGGETLSVTSLAPPPPHFSVVALYGAQFTAGRTYQIVSHPAGPDRAQSLLDAGGQIIAVDTCRVAYSAMTDSTGPKVAWTTFPTIDNVSSPASPLHIGFSRPLDTALARDILRVYDSLGTKVMGVSRWVDARHLTFVPDPSWPDTSIVVVTLDSVCLADTHGNRGPAQVRTWKFRPLTQSQMGAISGRVDISDSAWRGVVCHLEARPVTKGETVTHVLAAPGTFEFALPVGRWIIEGYLDLNGDKRWSAGTFDPYRPSEPRTIANDTLDVRARFTTEGAAIGF